MRLSNAPQTLGILALILGSVLVGFRSSIVPALAVWLTAETVFQVAKWRTVRRIGRYDNTWSPAVGVAVVLPGAMGELLAVLIGYVGWAALLGSVYLFLRLWLWAPNELLFLRNIPALGSFLTVTAVWIVTSLLEPLVDAILYKNR